MSDHDNIMRVFTTITNHDHLTYGIIATAYEIFVKAGYKDDFCIQNRELNDSGIIVFGGWNRLIFSPRYGLRPDPSHCTERFLNSYNGESV